MAMYTVVSAVPDGGFSNKFGQYRCWTLSLQDSNGEVIQAGLNQKMRDDGSYAAEPSGEMDLEVTTDQAGRTKAKRAYNGPADSGASSRQYVSSSPGAQYAAAGQTYGQGEDPNLRQKRIVRQHSQEMAIRLLATGKTLDGLDLLVGLEPVEAPIRAALKKWADFFDSDVEAAAMTSPDVDCERLPDPVKDAAPAPASSVTDEIPF